MLVYLWSMWFTKTDSLAEACIAGATYQITLAHAENPYTANPT